MEQFIELIEETIYKSTIKDLKRYLRRLAGCTKWLICSDYCLEDKKKSNDVAVFTVLPYYDYIDNIQKDISEKAPTDIKKSRLIRESFINYHKSGLIFHFGFIFGKRGKHIFKDLSREHILSLLKRTINFVEVLKKNNVPISADDLQEFTNKIKALIREAERKTFSLKLMKKIILINLLAAYIAHLLCRETDVKLVGWFSDRDDIINAYDEIAFDLFYMNFNALCERSKIDVDSNVRLMIAKPSTNENEKMWYDELNRLPDFIAGTLADWDIAKNHVSKDKFLTMIEGCIADSNNIAILKLYAEWVWTCSRVGVNKL